MIRFHAVSFSVSIFGSILHIPNQDIVNVMTMVNIIKTSLQKMRDKGWNFHVDKVVKYGVENLWRQITLS